MTFNSTESPSGKQSATTERLGTVFAYASLGCTLLFWVEFALSRVPGVPGQNLTGFQWFKIMAVAVVLAVAAIPLRSKLWKLSLPVAIAMFLFIMYVMGT